MPIAIRASQGLNHKLEPASIAGPLRRNMRRCRSRQPRQAISQPRCGPAADHQRHSVGRRLGQLRGDLGARRSAGADAGRMFDRREFQDHHWRGYRRCVAGPRFHRKAAARWPAGRAGHFLSRALRRHQRERHRRRGAARAFPHRARRADIGIVRLVGRYRGAGLGHRSKTAAACGLTAPCSTTVRTSSSIPATTSMRIVRWSAELKLPDGGVWRNIVTEEKSVVAHSLAQFRGNYKYNWLDENFRAFNAAGADVRAMGRS